MASVLELENLLLRERDRVIEHVASVYGVNRDMVKVTIENVIGSSYVGFEESYRRGISSSNPYKFEFRVDVMGDRVERVGFYGIKLFRKCEGSYVCLLYVPGYEPKDVLEGCAHYFYGLYDDVSYEKTMRVLLDHLREVLRDVMAMTSVKVSDRVGLSDHDSVKLSDSDYSSDQDQAKIEENQVEENISVVDEWNL